MEQRYDVFTGLIMSISRSILKIKNEEMAVFGYKGKQVQCLFALFNSAGGASLKELCEKCDEDKGAMSRTVKELSEKNLVYVEGSSTQKYRNPIKLTKEGTKFARIVADKISNMLSLASQGISDSDREVLYKSLSCISANLSKICEGYGEKNG